LNHQLDSKIEGDAMLGVAFDDGAVAVANAESVQLTRQVLMMVLRRTSPGCFSRTEWLRMVKRIRQLLRRRTGPLYPWCPDARRTRSALEVIGPGP
jgi:hypothetical protein